MPMICLSRVVAVPADSSPLHKGKGHSRVQWLPRLIANLPEMAEQELQALWRSLEGTEPPQMPAALLRHLIAYKAQAQHYGALRPAIERELLRQAGRPGQGEPGHRTTVRPGTRLIREWRGRTINVQVRERDVVWEGRSYRSLSQVAREVTGAKWSGPRFFGLGTDG